MGLAEVVISAVLRGSVLLFLLGVAGMVALILVIGAIRGAQAARNYGQPNAENPTQLDLQIKEIAAYLNTQRRLGATYAMLETLVTSLYYSAATALLLCFIANVGPQILLGLGGLTLLVTTFVHQMQRPDLRKVACRKRATLLLEMLRRAEIVLSGVRAEGDLERAQTAALEFLSELDRIRQGETAELNRAS